MSTIRPIQQREKDLITHLLNLANAKNLADQIPKEVSPYNLQQPESINLSGTDAEDYDSDIITVEYFDTDRVRVIISLTKSKKGELLDMDFWKEDFANIADYPSPDKVEVIK